MTPSRDNDREINTFERIARVETTLHNHANVLHAQLLQIKDMDMKVNQVATSVSSIATELAKVRQALYFVAAVSTAGSPIALEFLASLKKLLAGG